MLIEIAYGLREKQYLYAYEVEEGTTVTEAIEASPLKKNLPDLVRNFICFRYLTRYHIWFQVWYHIGTPKMYDI